MLKSQANRMTPTTKTERAAREPQLSLGPDFSPLMLLTSSASVSCVVSNLSCLAHPPPLHPLFLSCPGCCFSGNFCQQEALDEHVEFLKGVVQGKPGWAESKGDPARDVVCRGCQLRVAEGVWLPP